MSLLAIEQLLIATSFAVPALLFLYRKRLKVHAFLLFLLCTAFVSGLLLARVAIIDLRFERELAEFDLDGDRSHSEDEASPEQIRAMAAWSQDTARGLAPLTGIGVAPFLVLLSFGGVAVIVGLRRAVTRLLAGHT